MDKSGATARIENREQFRRWLEKQPGEEGRRVAALLTARVALRVLPGAVQFPSTRGSDNKERQQRLVDLIGASLRAIAVAWIAGKYLTLDNKIASAAAEAAAVAAAFSAPDASAVGRAAAFAVAAVTADLPFAAAEAARSADAAARAAYSWGEINTDIALYERQGTDSLADAPLWLNDMPDWWIARFTRFRKGLPPDENWQVWLDWYEDRLAGRSRGEAHELVFASVPQAEWDKGPAAANAWIKQHLPQQAEFPQALASVPSAYTFGWNASGRIAIVAGAQNATAFPFPPNAGDHAATLDAARSLIERLLADLKAGRINCARPDYRESMERYVGDLPTMAGSGNLILADAEARILRDLFAAEADILSAPFAARLRTILQQHIALRAFYPEVERLYDAVRSGHLERPLPDDAVAAVGLTIKENTPRYFEPEVSEGLKRVEREPPEVALSPDDIAGHGSAPIQPPPDPLGELEPRKSRSFSTASAINALWKTFLKGKDIPEALEGWRDVAGKLGENVGPVIDWLKDFLSKGGS